MLQELTCKYEHYMEVHTSNLPKFPHHAGVLSPICRKGGRHFPWYGYKGVDQIPYVERPDVSEINDYKEMEYEEPVESLIDYCDIDTRPWDGCTCTICSKSGVAIRTELTRRNVDKIHFTQYNNLVLRTKNKHPGRRKKDEREEQ